MKNNIVFVHDSLMGGSAQIARSFDYPTTNIQNYYDNTNNKIILFVRQSYITESIMPELEFITRYYDRIVGVIITDDKANGPRFAEKAHLIHKIGLPIITIIDRVMTNENKVNIERWIKKYAK